MGILSKVKSKVKPAAVLSKVKSVAKPSTLAKIALAGTGVGALTMAVTAGAAKKVEKTEYKISNWGPLESDPSKVSLKYSPALSLAKSDKLTVSGTPFDGTYTDLEYRTRNEVYIKPATPVTAAGTGGTFRVKTSMAARAKGAASATKAGTRTGLKKTGSAIKKGANVVAGKVKSVVGGFWDWIKWKLMIASVVGIIGLVIYMKFFSPAALASFAAPAPLLPK
jgi:hypothetical protein